MKYLSNKDGFLGIDNKFKFKEKVIIVPFGLEKTVSYGGGTKNGPKEIIKASHQVELYDEELNCEPFKKIGIKAESTNGSLLWEPWSIVKDDGSPYKVFTPFYRKGCMHAKAPREPIPVPTNTKYLHDKKNSLDVTQLVLLQKNSWDTKLSSHWDIGESGAHTRFQKFIYEGLGYYKTGRNLPSKPYVSRISPYLHFGEISPRRIFAEVMKSNIDEDNKIKYLSEIGRRDFS